MTELLDTSKRLIVEAVRPQPRYANGRRFALGDLRPVTLAGSLLLIVWGVHDGLGVPLPSDPVVEFFEHTWGIWLMVWGISHARTRKPE